jgi:hypothetical protein
MVSASYRLLRFARPHPEPQSRPRTPRAILRFDPSWGPYFSLVFRLSVGLNWVTQNVSATLDLALGEPIVAGRNLAGGQANCSEQISRLFRCQFKPVSDCRQFRTAPAASAAI